jgi:hypothetical protein
MKRQVHETKDGRFWLIDNNHPETDHTVAVCRRLESKEVQPDGSWRLTHTAVISRSDLKPTQFTYGE